MKIEDRTFPTNQKSSKLFFILAAFFGILAMFPAYFWGFPVGADFDNHFRFVLPFYDEIAQGNYLPGWLAESNYGFGDARFRFYPPFLYYLLCLFRFLTGDWYFAALIVFTLFSVTGTLGVYCWTRRSFNNQISIFAAMLFAIIPYHLTQFYQASLLAEFAAASLLPFAFLFVEKLTTDKTENLSATLFNTAALGAVYSLIITTHLPTTVIGSLCLGIFALILIDRINYKKSLFFCASAVMLGLISSSWFWVKMISELGWIQAGEKVSSAHYDYRNNFIFSPFSLTNLNVWYASFIAALTVAVFLPSIIIWRQIFGGKNFESVLGKYFTDSENKVKRRLRAAFILAVLSLFMTTDLSRPIWAIVPKLKDIQFPYRWLMITSLMICPITALCVPVWREIIRQKKFRAIYLPLFLAFFIALFFTVQDLVFDSGFITRESFLQKIEDARGARSFNDWLPRAAREVKDLQPLNGQINAGTRRVTVTDWQSHRRIFSVTAGSETQIRLQSYSYPLWRAFIIQNGQKIQTETTQAEDGTLLVHVPNEQINVEVYFVEPSRTKISLLIAAFGWTMIFALLIIGFAKSKSPKSG